MYMCMSHKHQNNTYYEGCFLIIFCSILFHFLRLVVISEFSLQPTRNLTHFSMLYCHLEVVFDFF